MPSRNLSESNCGGGFTWHVCWQRISERAAKAACLKGALAQCAFQAKGSPSGADFTLMQGQRQSKRSVLALLRGNCGGSGLALAALTLLSAPAGSSAGNVSDPAVPGVSDNANLFPAFKVERYAHIWQRSPFSKMFLMSWLKDGSQEVTYVQNSDTNVVQRITEQANQNNVRLLEVRSNGCEYPRVKVYTSPRHERESPRMPCKTLPGRLHEEQLELKHLDT